MYMEKCLLVSFCRGGDDKDSLCIGEPINDDGGIKILKIICGNEAKELYEKLTNRITNNETK